jgi:hypothetical protein
MNITNKSLNISELGAVQVSLLRELLFHFNIKYFNFGVIKFVVTKKLAVLQAKQFVVTKKLAVLQAKQ